MARTEEKLRRILELLQEGDEYAKVEDVKQLFAGLIPYVKDVKPEMRSLLSYESKRISQELGKIDKKLEAFLEKSRSFSAKKAEATIAPLLAEIRSLKIRQNQLVDVLSFHEAFEALREEIPEVNAEVVRDLLETLEDENRLDASAIKNLPEWKENVQQLVAANRALYQLLDVNVSGITSGQSIQWDGTEWVPYTPAGSGGTPVWGEELESQGSGTDFTLANTPIAGTVRLFRNGVYQREGANGDYTISGANITLTYALDATYEKLTADYSY